MSSNSKQFGDEGEKLAGEYIQKKGFSIIEYNYRFGKGEIDIIAKDGEYLVFVEVKSRKNLEFGEPEYALTKNKVNQIRKIASAYLYEKNLIEVDCRFDVVAILQEQGKDPVINHIENAF